MTNLRAILIAFFLPLTAQAFHVVAPGVDITTDKVSYLTGMIDKTSEKAYMTSLINTIALPGPRIVVIDSPGGYVDSGEAILQAMKREQAAGTKQVCVVMGGASSMAFNFLTFCDVRLATRNSHMLVHKVEAGQLNPEMRTTAKNLRDIAEILDRTDEPYRRANAKAMHLQLIDYDKLCDNETFWRSPELLARGYLQGIVTVAQ